MTIADFLQRLRNPKETFKTAVVAVTLASLSIVGTQLATGLWSVIVARLEFPMIRAQIESLRQDLGQAPCAAIPMIAAHAAEWNITIEHEKESNRHWYSDWAVTDRWNEVPRLEMPCRTP